MDSLTQMLTVFSLTFARVYCTLVIIKPIRIYLGVIPLLSLSLGVSLCFFSFLDITNFHYGVNSYNPIFLFIKEALYGFLLGVPLAFIAETPTIAGRLFDTFRAAQFCEQLLPQTNERSSILEQLGIFLVPLYVFSYSGYKDVFNLLETSFNLLPVLSLNSINLFSSIRVENFINLSLSVFRTAVILAAPCIIGCALIDITITLLSRSLARINMVFEALPFKLVGGLLFLWLVLSMSDFSELKSLYFNGFKESKEIISVL